MDSPNTRNSRRRIAQKLLKAGTGLLDPSELSPEFLRGDNATQDSQERTRDYIPAQLDQSIIAEDWTILQVPDEASGILEAGSPPVFHRLQRARLREDLSKFKKLLSRQRIDLDELKQLSKQGVPSEVRAIVWKLLLGYIPLQKDKRRQTIDWRRGRYNQFVASFLGNGVSQEHQAVLRDIDADVPRTFPRGLISLFEKEPMREMLRRILFIYAVKHPKRGYWQGLNDLLVPFVVVFLAWSLGCEILDLNDLSTEELDQALRAHFIEPDVYWCACFFLRDIQHNYVIRAPEIDVQSSFDKMRTLLSFRDAPLLRHLDSLGVDFVFFGCRWLICLLIRELRLDNLARLWDTYFTYGSSLFVFHTYFCVAYLQSLSKQLQKCDDISSALVLLNNPPTDDWSRLKLETVLRSVDDLVREEKVYTLAISTLTMLVGVAVALLLLATAALYIMYVRTLQTITAQQRHATLPSPSLD